MKHPASFVDVTQHLTCDEIATLRRLADGLRLGTKVPDHLVEDLRSELLLNALANAPFLAANRDSLVPLATAHMNYDVLDCIRRVQRKKSRLINETVRIDDADDPVDADGSAPVWDLPGPDPRLALDDLLDGADRRRLLDLWRARFRRRMAALDPAHLAAAQARLSAQGRPMVEFLCRKYPVKLTVRHKPGWKVPSRTFAQVVWVNPAHWAPPPRGTAAAKPAPIALPQHERTLSPRETYAYCEKKTGYPSTQIHAVFKALAEFLRENAQRGNISHIDDVASVRSYAKGAFETLYGPLIKGRNHLLVAAVEMDPFRSIGG